MKIETLDNPGWMVIIDLVETAWECMVINRIIVERSDRDWVQHEVVNSQFVGCGGPENLSELINIFFQVIDGRPSADAQKSITPL